MKRGRKIAYLHKKQYFCSNFGANFTGNLYYSIMKKITLFFFVCFAAIMQAERIEPMPFGDMESWTVRYIKEAKLLGGKTKTLYCLAPTDTIWENGPYYYGQNGNPWATSNAYANIIGIEKAAGTMMPEAREDGGTCCRLNVEMLGVRVMGMIDIEVLVAGTLFAGRNLEPITTAKDPYQNIDFGVPFTGRPSALMFDYKCIVSPEEWVWFAKGTTKPKKQDGHDEAEAYVYLQHRWEDDHGKIHSIRVGTGYKRFTEDQLTWVNGYRLPIHYGDITGEEWYEDYMGFKGIQRTMNSKGKMTPIIEEGWDGTLEPTHIVIMLTSGKYEAFVGHAGNILWVDNVSLVYEN